MKIFIISLEKEHQRRVHIIEQFDQEDLCFEFFNAITPHTIEQGKNQLGLNNKVTELHQNEVACLLSHAILWKKAVDENLDYITIFEDDIYLGNNAKDFLQDTKWIPKDCKLIKLETFYKKAGIELWGKHYPLNDGRKLLSLATVHMGAGGYIISKQVAKELLTLLMESQKIIPVDHIVFREYPIHKNVKVYQMTPALCIQDVILKKGKTIFPSSLENVRNERKGEKRPKKQLSLGMKIKRELSRIISSFYQILKDHLNLYKGIKIIKINFK